MKLELNVKQIEISDNTFFKISNGYKFKKGFEYMNTYCLKNNEQIEDGKCKIIFDNNLSLMMNIEDPWELKFAGR